jgi:glutathione S-transferase
MERQNDIVIQCRHSLTRREVRFAQRIDRFTTLGDVVECAQPQTDIVLYGAPYSVYTRIIRLVLAEKGLTYRLEEVDIFGKDRSSVAYRARHPFMRIPALSVDGLDLYETSAIARYLDERFPTPPLQPTDITQRARMNQFISLMDNYAFRGIVWNVFVEQVRKPVADQALVQAGLETAQTLLGEMERSLAINPWLGGATVYLADLWAAPMFTLFDLAGDGRAAIARAPSVRRWLDAFNRRASALQTRFPIEVAQP